jgi:hypothetical protein
MLGFGVIDLRQHRNVREEFLIVTASLAKAIKKFPLI